LSQERSAFPGEGSDRQAHRPADGAAGHERPGFYSQAQHTAADALFKEADEKGQRQPMRRQVLFGDLFRPDVENRSGFPAPEDGVEDENMGRCEGPDFARHVLGRNAAIEKQNAPPDGLSGRFPKKMKAHDAGGVVAPLFVPHAQNGQAGSRPEFAPESRPPSRFLGAEF